MNVSSKTYIITGVINNRTYVLNYVNGVYIWVDSLPDRTVSRFVYSNNGHYDQELQGFVKTLTDHTGVNTNYNYDPYDGSYISQFTHSVRTSNGSYQRLYSAIKTTDPYDTAIAMLDANSKSGNFVNVLNVITTIIFLFLFIGLVIFLVITINRLTKARLNAETTGVEDPTELEVGEL